MKMLNRRPGERPLEAAVRLARPMGLERQVCLAYERFYRAHGNAELAAVEACEEWFPVPATEAQEVAA